MQVGAQSLVLITTGGTIAGWAQQADAQAHYQAGALPGQALLAALPASLGADAVRVDELVRINSKDADSRLWWQIYQRVQQHLADDSVRGIVITHGTDTLEETAFFLSQVLPLPLTKPVLMVCAMRPASHPQADGPQNLADALQLAAQPSVAAHGVLVCCGGLLYQASQVQKLHGSSLQPFVQRQYLQAGLAAGSAAAWATCADVQAGKAQGKGLGADFSGSFWQNKPKNLPEKLSKLNQIERCPRVEILSSHAGSTGLLVQALLAQHAAQPIYALVVAGTGCGTIHQALHMALHAALAQGIRVVRSSQCLGDVLVPPDDDFESWPDLSPRQARVRLILEGWA